MSSLRRYYARWQERILHFVTSPIFDGIILFIIFLNAVTLAIDTPENANNANLQSFLNISEFVFLTLFTIEMVLKLIALGPFRGRHAYFRSMWNIIDFTVVVVGFISLLPAVRNYSVVRCIRILRPLRTVSRVEGLRMLVNAMLSALPMLGSVVILFALLLWICSVLGIQMFKSTVHNRCYSTTYPDVFGTACSSINNNTGCDWYGCGFTCESGYVCDVRTNKYYVSVYNYDHILNALILTFKVISKDDWPTVMFTEMQTTAGLSFIYFFIVVLFGAYFCLNLFLAVLTQNVRQQSARIRLEAANLRDAALQFVEVADRPELGAGTPEAAQEAKRVHAIFRVRAFLLKHLLSPPVEMAIIGVTLVNVVALLIDHYPNNSGLDTALSTVNTICSWIFLADAAIRLVIMGPIMYFSSAANTFDFFLVCISLPEMISGGGAKTFTGLRALRLIRLLRLLRSWSGFRAVSLSVISAMADLGYIMLLFVLFLFISTILGMQLFQGTTPYGRLHFNSLGMSVLSIIAGITGPWTGLMKHLVDQTNYATLIFSMYVYVVGNWLFVNLITAVLVDKLNLAAETVDEESDDIMPISRLPASQRRQQSVARYHKETLDEYIFAPRKETRKKALLMRFITTDSEPPPETFAQGAFRSAVRRLLTNSIFEAVVFGIVLANAATVAWDRPSASAREQDILNLTDIVFAVIFSVEMIMKMVAYGFKGYFQDRWNWVDFAALVTTILSNFIQFFRIFRSLRLLRLCARVRGLRLILHALYLSISSLAGVAVLSLFVMTVFGVSGVQLFGGRMYRCHLCDAESLFCSPTVPEDLYCSANECSRAKAPAGMAYRWSADYAFNHVGEALLTLLQISIGDDWMSVMFAGMDSGTQDGECMKQNRRPYWALYFIAFFFLANFLLLNLFISALIRQFVVLRKEVNGCALMTQRQQDWIQATKLLLKHRVYNARHHPEPKTLQFKVYLVVRSPYFDWVSTLLIVLNMLAMALDHWPMPDGWTSSIIYVNLVFVCLFTAELALQFFAYGTRLLHDPWAIFDLFVVVFSWVGLIVEFLASGVSGLAIMRMLRVTRLFRLVHYLTGLRLLFSTLVWALPAFCNVFALLVVVLFIFGAIGVQLFGTIRRTGVFSPLYHFEDLPHAVFVLSTIITQQLWTSTLAATRIQSPSCSDAVGNCGNSWGLIYFPVFLIFCSFILINLTVAVIIDAFNDREIINIPGLNNFSHFRRKWMIYDPNGTKYIHCRQFVTIFRTLPPPLGMGTKVFSTSGLLAALSELHIPITKDKEVKYKDCVRALSRRVFDMDFRESLSTLEYSKHINPLTAPDPDIQWMIHHYYAVLMFQISWKKRLQNGTARAVRVPNTARMRSPSSSSNDSVLWLDEPGNPLSHKIQPTPTDPESPDAFFAPGPLAVDIESVVFPTGQLSPHSTPHEEFFECAGGLEIDDFVPRASNIGSVELVPSLGRDVLAGEWDRELVFTSPRGDRSSRQQGRVAPAISAVPDSSGWNAVRVTVQDAEEEEHEDLPGPPNTRTETSPNLCTTPLPSPGTDEPGPLVPLVGRSSPLSTANLATHSGFNGRLGIS